MTAQLLPSQLLKMAPCSVVAITGTDGMVEVRSQKNGAQQFKVQSANLHKLSTFCISNGINFHFEQGGIVNSTPISPADARAELKQKPATKAATKLYNPNGWDIGPNTGVEDGQNGHYWIVAGCVVLFVCGLALMLLGIAACQRPIDEPKPIRMSKYVGTQSRKGE